MNLGEKNNDFEVCVKDYQTSIIEKIYRFQF